MNFKYKKITLLMAALFTLSGCGSSDDEDSTETEVQDMPPVLGLPDPSSIKEGDTGTITAQVSDDNAGVTISWQQTDGPELTLSGTDSETLTVTVPALDANIEAAFSVTATDSSGQSITKTHTINLLNNLAPSVFGNFEDVPEKSTAMLTVSAEDEDGTIASYSWEQVGGPELQLSGTNSEAISFVAPSVSEPTPIDFVVTVTDDSGDATLFEQSVMITQVLNTYSLSGTVVGEDFSESTVSAHFMGESYSQTSDSEGNFNFTLEADDDETNLFSRVNAVSATNSALEFSAFIPELELVTESTPAGKSLTNESEGGASTVTLSEVSTALVALIVSANGGEAPENLDQFTLVEKGVDPDAIIEAAAVVKYVIDNDMALPEDADNVIDLIELTEVYNEFVAQVEADDPGGIAAKAEEIINDPELTPSIDESTLPEYYVRTYPTADGFLARGGQQYTFASDNTGSFLHRSGAYSYDWTLDNGKINLSFIDGEARSGFYTPSVGIAGLTQDQVNMLNDFGIYQVEVISEPQKASFTRIVEGQKIDTYRLEVEEVATMVPVQVGDVVIAPNGVTNNLEYDASMRKPSSEQEIGFDADEISGAWAIHTFDQGYSRFTLDPLVLNSDGTGSLRDSEQSLTWQLDEQGLLTVTFADGSYQTNQVIDQLGEDMQVLSVAYNADDQVLATDVTYGFAIPSDTEEVASVMSEPSMFWQTMVNQWTRGNWNDGRLEFFFEGEWYNGVNMFGFQLTQEDSRRLDFVDGVESDYTLSGESVGWQQNQADVTIKHFGRWSCSDALEESCRIREWEVLKSTEGVIGQRLYVKEYDYYLVDDQTGNLDSEGSISESFPPRLNFYENIPEDYWMSGSNQGAMPAALKNKSNKRLILSPSSTHNDVR